MVSVLYILYFSSFIGEVCIFILCNLYTLRKSYKNVNWSCCLERRYINRIIMQNMVAKFYSYKLLICYIILVKCRIKMSCSEGIISVLLPKQAIEMFGRVLLPLREVVSVVYVILHCRLYVFFSSD